MKRFLMSHVRSLAVTACLLAIGGTGTAVALTSSGGSPSASATPTTATTTPPPTTAAPQSHHEKAHPVRGKIASISPTSWTLTTARGRTITVEVTSSTHYGTLKAPSSASSFSTGQTVAVLGQRKGTTVTATRIIARPAGKSTTAPTTAPPTTAPTA